MTTPPVTAGGKTWWMMPTPRKLMSRPAIASTTPATRMEPVTSESLSCAARMASTPPTKDALVPR